MVAALLLLIAAPAHAHHAFAAEFDAQQPITLHGTITRIEWINPHTWFHINVKEPDGKVTEWMIEGGTPNTLLRRGVDKNTVPTGLEVVVEGYRAKNGTNRANGRDITLPDGKKLFLGSSGIGAPADGKDPTEKK
jgi:hypothetical protein